MMKSLQTAIVLLVTLLPMPAFAQTSAAGEPLTWTSEEIARLIFDCGMRTTQMTGRLYNYTFHATDTEYVLDKNGRVKSQHSKVSEVYPISHGNLRKWIYVQISEDGVPLTAEKLAHERERAIKQTQELEAQPMVAPQGQRSIYQQSFSSYGIKVEKRGGLSRTVWFINPTDFLVSHDFYAPQRVSFGGRQAFLLRFRPRPGYVYDKTNVPYPQGIEDFGRTMSQLGGRIWIDATDKVIARLEATPARELTDSSGISPDENAPVWFELTRLPNGTWAPRASRYNSYGREAVFWNTSLSRSLDYSDYKVFKTTVEVEKIQPDR